MRIIAGMVKGTRLLPVPGQHTRPTTDKVKESLFHRIGPYFTGGKVLDLFAGTGALALEALSRGMDCAVMIDSDLRSIQTIKQNIQRTHMEQRTEVWRCSAHRAIQKLQAIQQSFDLILLDPPYGSQSFLSLANMLHHSGIVHRETTLVLEQSVRETCATELGPFVRQQHAVYGETQIAIYQLRAADPTEV